MTIERVIVAGFKSFAERTEVALRPLTILAVNAHGGFGRWRWAVVRHPGEIRDVIMQCEKASLPAPDALAGGG